MQRRCAFTIPLAAALSLAAGACSTPGAGRVQRTAWTVRTSEGFDALAFLGPLSGKPFYARYYESEIAAFKPRVPAAALDALASLHADADAAGGLLWPMLALIFSGGRDDTLDDLLAAIDSAERTLRPPFEASAYWDPADWRLFVDAGPRLKIVLSALRAARFAEFRSRQLTTLESRRDELLALLGRLDVITEQERLLGRALDPRIEVCLLWFCRPHGVKVQGQRFLAYVQTSDETMVLTAAHEILHPPFDMKGPVAQDCLRVLQQDRLLERILAEKSKDTGYNTLEGIFDEDTAQALDQIIQERLGFGQPPRERWTTRDQGMHVLAAGLYGLLKTDRFDQTGGSIEAWMASAAASGRLAPHSLHAAAAAVLQRPVERLWVTPA